MASDSPRLHRDTDRAWPTGGGARLARAARERASELWHARSGVAFVETLVVYVPVMTAFFGAWLLGEVYSAQLVIKRATSAAARAATVILPDDPSTYGGSEVDVYDGLRKGLVHLAAWRILDAAPQVLPGTPVEVNIVPMPDGGHERNVVVTVRAAYECLVLSWACGLDGMLELTDTITLPYHGALYEYVHASE